MANLVVVEFLVAPFRTTYLNILHSSLRILSVSSMSTIAVTDRQQHRALETWDNIKGALFGVAATPFKDFVGEVVPGFHEQFQRSAEEAKTNSGMSRQISPGE